MKSGHEPEAPAISCPETTDSPETPDSFATDERLARSRAIEFVIDGLTATFDSPPTLNAEAATVLARIVLLIIDEVTRFSPPRSLLSGRLTTVPSRTRQDRVQGYGHFP